MGVIDGVTNGGSLPALERLAQFTSGRHRLIANNVANISVPEYRPTDVSVESFQAQMGKAIDARRAKHGGSGGELRVESTREVSVTPDRMQLTPQEQARNILFHDGNDRDLERTMQDLVENFMMFRFASEMMRKQFEGVKMAIRERL